MPDDPITCIVTIDDYAGNIRFSLVKLERRNISRRNRKSICGTDKDYQGHEAPLHPFLYMDLHEIFGKNAVQCDHGQSSLSDARWRGYR